jgi:L-ribulose-5-phosphate 3-epimerase
MSHRHARRDFLKQGAWTAGALCLPGLVPLASLAAGRTPLFKLSLAQWSLHRTIRAGKLDNPDFARAAKEEFGISAVEYVNQFFKDKAADKTYLGEMKKRAADAGVESRLIMIDGEGALGDADPAKRKQAVENHYKWVEAAKFLGCFAIRVNAASSGTYQEQLERAADGLHQLTHFARDHRIAVLVENHGGLSSNGAWLAAVIAKVRHGAGTLPDFGNFNLGGGKEYDKYQGVQELMPLAKAVSAKSYDFDADGNETSIDYRRIMKIVLDAGYRSFVGIEYEGNRLGEPEGIRATKQLLERVREELTPMYRKEN